MADIYSLLARAIPMSTTTASQNASIFMDNHIILYGIPARELTCSRTQFIRKLFRVALHLPWNKTFDWYDGPSATYWRLVRFHKAIMAGLWHYLEQHQRGWTLMCRGWRMRIAFNCTVQLLWNVLPKTHQNIPLVWLNFIPRQLYRLIPQRFHLRTWNVHDWYTPYVQCNTKTTSEWNGGPV